jgi:hypothetical protein
MVGVAAVVVTASLMSPIGTLLWGVSLDFLGASLTIAVAAIATLGAVAVFAAKTRGAPSA